MLALSQEIPDDPNGQPFPIKRVPAKGNIQGIITTRQPLGCPTHFWGQRTVPCTTPDCRACDAGAPTRWHGYLTAYNHTEQLHFLLEMTAAAAEPIFAYARELGDTRGALIKATRPDGRTNGRIHCTLRPADILRYPIPPEPDLRKILARLWAIPYEEIHTPDPLARIATIQTPGQNGNRLPPAPTPEPKPARKWQRS